MLSTRQFIGAATTALSLITGAFLLALAAGDARAQSSASECDAAGEIALLPSPWAPWKGAPLRVTDFDVVLRLADGFTKTWARNKGVPKVEITDPLQAHLDIMKRLSDTDMHNLTAYLVTLK